MPRTQDPAVTERILDAALKLASERGFAAISMEEIAARAGVGRPAIYRRFKSKAEVVVAAIGRKLPEMPPSRSPGTDVADHLRRLVDTATPEDPEGYAGLIGGLMAERLTHPELIEAYREKVLLPRRAVVAAAVVDGQREGRLRGDLAPDVAVDLLGGIFLARVFAGLPMTHAWREKAFGAWWRAIAVG